MKLIAYIFISLLISGSALARPNFIFILSDDSGAESYVPYGGDGTWQTPNIDSLSTDGMTFDNMFAERWCAPSRAMFVAGRFRNRHNANSPSMLDGPLDTDLFMVAESLSNAGYDTAFAGKWNLTFGKSNIPEDEEQAYAEQHQHIRDCGYQDVLQTVLGNTIEYGDPTGETNWMPYKVNSSVLEWLDNRGSDPDPFYLQYSFGLVHVANSDDYGMNGNLGIPPTPLNPTDTNDGTNNNELYEYAMIQMDIYVSNVLAKVESMGISSNTIVIYSSDNGSWFRINSSFQGTIIPGGKQSQDDTAAWVPFYIRWPGTIEAGSRYEHQTCYADIYSTLIDIAGGSIPEYELVDGRSFYPHLLGSDRPLREFYARNAGSTIRGNYLKINLVYGPTNIYRSIFRPYGDELISFPQLNHSEKQIYYRILGYHDSVITTTNVANPWQGYVTDNVLKKNP